MLQRLKFRYLLIGIAVAASIALGAQFLPPDREAPGIAQKP